MAGNYYYYGIEHGKMMYVRTYKAVNLQYHTRRARHRMFFAAASFRIKKKQNNTRIFPFFSCIFSLSIIFSPFPPSFVLSLVFVRPFIHSCFSPCPTLPPTHHQMLPSRSPWEYMIRIVTSSQLNPSGSVSVPQENKKNTSNFNQNRCANSRGNILTTN